MNSAAISSSVVPKHCFDVALDFLPVTLSLECSLRGSGIEMVGSLLA